MEKLCEKCEQRETCQTPCKAVNDILWKDNRVMERHYGNMIVCYPRGKEIHFSEIEDFKVDDFSDGVPWSSSDLKLRKTAVFIERFFNKVPCKVLAERFGVKENTIVCMYKQAVEQLGRIIEVLDAKKEGMQGVKQSKFSEDQKYFLLVAIFGFTGAEVARMFKKDRNVVNMKVARLTEKYQAAFGGLVPKKKPPIEDQPNKSCYDGLSVSEIKERMIF